MRHEHIANVVGYGWSLGDERYQYYAENTCDFNPTYEQCVANKDIPIAVLDVAVVHKGSVDEGFEVYHTHRVDDIKKRKIRELTKNRSFKLYEISAEKILCQTKTPENIYKLCEVII